MGFFKSFLKTAVTGDSKYLTRYDSAIVAKSAILELCRCHAFKAYLIQYGKEPIKIDTDTDLSGEFSSCFEIDLKRKTRYFFVGFAAPPTETYKEVLQGILDRDVYAKCFNWNLQGDLSGGHYASSFDLLRELLQKIKWLEERQRTYLKDLKT